ncbi:MAG: hypothetical protein AAGD25_23620 [Cyanobacteria bacterium P01_F01_bin.150]
MNTNPNPQWRSRLDAAARQFQTQYLPKIRKAQAEYGPKVQQAVSQTVDKLGQIDTKLKETKYGDRYVTLKQEVSSAKQSYANTKTKIKSGYVDTGKQGSAEPYPQAAKVGEAVAKAELSLRQRLKGVLQKLADRL